MKKTSYSRIPWDDRFNQPTTKQLRGGLSARQRPIFDRTRRRILEIDDFVETLAWYGDGWNWSIEFRKSRRGGDEPVAVIIPSPEDLQLAVPMDPEFANSLPVKRMKRAIRDGLELAREPFDTRWGIWSVSTLSLVDDLQHLIESKLRHVGQGKVAG